MKKNSRQSIVFAIIAMSIVGLVIGYSYSAEQTRQKGFNFGNELSQIQEDVKQIQVDFNSKLTQWDEGDLEVEELLEYADRHLEKLDGVMKEYDKLEPPPQFSASRELFKLSTSSQLQSDKYYIEWVKLNQESYKIRSDSLLQESFDYEMLALGEFNKAKLGYTEYDEEPAKFDPPDTYIIDKVNKIWQNMIDRCHADTKIQAEIDQCIVDAGMWKEEHLP